MPHERLQGQPPAGESRGRLIQDLHERRFRVAEPAGGREGDTARERIPDGVGVERRSGGEREPDAR